MVERFTLGLLDIVGVSHPSLPGHSGTLTCTSPPPPPREAVSPPPPPPTNTMMIAPGPGCFQHHKMCRLFPVSVFLFCTDSIRILSDPWPSLLRFFVTSSGIMILLYQCQNALRRLRVGKALKHFVLSQLNKLYSLPERLAFSLVIC